ncbi:MAG: hypothetical protein IJM18_08600 [Clostridia bacterium]|nr:hypothetical protein [Clostridia bacterium]
MKRRVLAFVGLALVIAGFVMIPVSLFYNLNFLIPVGLILAAFLLLTYIKRMPSETDVKEEPGVITDEAGEDEK